MKNILEKIAVASLGQKFTWAPIFPILVFLPLHQLVFSLLFLLLQTHGCFCLFTFPYTEHFVLTSLLQGECTNAILILQLWFCYCITKANCKLSMLGFKQVSIFNATTPFLMFTCNFVRQHFQKYPSTDTFSETELSSKVRWAPKDQLHRALLAAIEWLVLDQPYLYESL